MKKGTRQIVYYFYAPAWDDINYKKRNAFADECKRCGIYFETVNVDTKEGAAFSCKMNVRNVPTAVIVKNGKTIGVEKGNYIHEVIAKYS